MNLQYCFSSQASGVLRQKKKKERRKEEKKTLTEIAPSIIS